MRALYFTSGALMTEPPEPITFNDNWMYEDEDQYAPIEFEMWDPSYAGSFQDICSWYASEAQDFLSLFSNNKLTADDIDSLEYNEFIQLNLTNGNWFIWEWVEVKG